MVNRRSGGFVVQQPHSLRELATLSFCNAGLHKELNSEDREIFNDIITFNLKYKVMIIDNNISVLFLGTPKDIFDLDADQEFCNLSLVPKESTVYKFKNINLRGLLDSRISYILENDAIAETSEMLAPSMWSYPNNNEKILNETSLISLKVTRNSFLDFLKLKIKIIGTLFQDREYVSTIYRNYDAFNEYLKTLVF